MENNNSLFDLQIDPIVSSHLSDSAKWSKFLAIVGFIMCGFMILVGLFAGSMLATAMSMSGGSELLGAAGLGTLYIVLALIYFFPCLFLYRFASNMQTALRNTDQQKLVDSFRNLKSCYKFMGILTIIILAIYVLAIIIGVLTAVSMR